MDLRPMPDSSVAVERIMALKGRPPNMALPVLAGSWAQVERLAEIPERYQGGPAGELAGTVDGGIARQASAGGVSGARPSPSGFRVTLS